MAHFADTRNTLNVSERNARAKFWKTLRERLWKLLYSTESEVLADLQAPNALELDRGELIEYTI